MQVAVVTLVLLVGVGVGVGVGEDSSSYRESLEEAFNDRAEIEKTIECFLNRIPCSRKQQKIKERALAAMRNGGTCPSTLCTPKQQQETAKSMELLQQNYPDLFLRLIASLFGIGY
ncbi:hypothetical protein OTU49_013083 [Cherax quadricarinatus]|uniref:Uncharacterized protein n=1 Tax=Cherax quadricarinatus TaxID=27406 RepID=A0AAW0VWU7_CHEQU